MLIEVHIIQNHAPSNLNRDDSGSPKTAIFGGYRRARISSQCLKRCYRTSKTFRDEVDGDGFGMHTRSMPEEIQRRLLDHAKTLKAEDQKAKFEEWAEKCQVKLSAILGKEEKKSGTEQPKETEESPSTSDEEDGTDNAIGTGKKEKNQTAQSVFWRETELDALFHAYRERIEWDMYVPNNMRNAYDKKGKVVAAKMINAAKAYVVSDENLFATAAKRIMEPKDNETGGKKEKSEEIANALSQLILDRFDPKIALKVVGLLPDGIPVDMALFGRMVTSNLMHNVEASSQFAHAISTHEFVREFDFWTRVDDRRDKRLDIWFNAFDDKEKLEAGTDGMGDAEFTSACFYNYFNVDFDALVDNLTGKAIKRDLDDTAVRESAKQRACNAVVGLVKAAIYERPSGKFNSMASPSLPTLVLVEVRDSHVPVSYVDAFARPVDPRNEEQQSDTGQVLHVDLRLESAERLIREANRITKDFRRDAKARLLFTGGLDIETPLKGENTNSPSDKSDKTGKHFVEKVPFTPIDDVYGLLTELRKVLGCPPEKGNA